MCRNYSASLDPLFIYILWESRILRYCDSCFDILYSGKDPRLSWFSNSMKGLLLEPPIWSLKLDTSSVSPLTRPLISSKWEVAPLIINYGVPRWSRELHEEPCSSESPSTMRDLFLRAVRLVGRFCWLRWLVMGPLSLISFIICSGTSFVWEDVNLRELYFRIRAFSLLLRVPYFFSLVLKSTNLGLKKPRWSVTLSYTICISWCSRKSWSYTRADPAALPRDSIFP